MNTDLATLDAEYNKLAQILAEGERDNFNQEWLSSKWVKWRYKFADFISQYACKSNEPVHTPGAPSIPGGCQKLKKPWKIPPSCASATSYKNLQYQIHMCILFPARVFFKWLPQPGAPKWRPTKPGFGQHLKAQNQKKPSKVAVHHSPCESGGGSTSECSWWSVATNKKVRNILILQISSVFPRSAKRHFKKKEVEAKVEQWAQNQRFDALPGNLGVPNFSGCHGWNTIGTITILFGMRYIDANPNSWVKSICLRHGTSAVWS